MADLLKARVAEKIRNLRLERGLTQEAVAREVGVTWRHYQRWEKGQSTPHWDNIEKLAKAFGVTPQEIIDPLGSGKPTTQATLEARLGELMRAVMELEGKVHKLAMNQHKKK